MLRLDQSATRPLHNFLAEALAVVDAGHPGLAGASCAVWTLPETPAHHNSPMTALRNP